MATLAAAAMKNPDFAAIVGQKAMNIFFSPEQTRRYTNHNKLLSMYEGCIGVKTGFTKKSGRCLVSAAGTRWGAPDRSNFERSGRLERSYCSDGLWIHSVGILSGRRQWLLCRLAGHRRVDFHCAGTKEPGRNGRDPAGAAARL